MTREVGSVTVALEETGDSLVEPLPPWVDAQDLPRWYALSPRMLPSRGEVLVVSLTPHCATAFAKIVGGKNLPIVSRYQELFGFKKYESDIFMGFGFDGAMLAAIEVGGWIELVIPLSPRCSLFALSASLSILLMALDAFEEVRTPSGERIQLMTLMPVVNRNPTWGAMVSGVTSPVFVKWLEENSANDTLKQEITDTMERAYYSLLGKKIPKRQKRDFSDFSAQISNDGRFLLGCPGNACDVATYPDGPNLGPGYGKHISCHNLDTPRQQLTLMAGLAKLYESADVALHGPHT